MEKWLSSGFFQRLFLNETFWINSAIVVAGTLVIYWLLRSAIRFISGRIARYSEDRHVRLTSILVEILRSTSQLLLSLIHI